MIYYLVTERHRYTMRRYLERWGRTIAPRVRMVTYEHVRCFMRGGSLRGRWTRGSLRRFVNAHYEARRELRPLERLPVPPSGHWIFSDVDRLTGAQREDAARFRDLLVRSGAARSVHNDPLATMGRYELLRALYERGLNVFDAYRLDEERRPRRYPVFLRDEDEHRGAEATLLPTPEAFASALARAADEGRSRAGRLAIEFAGQPDERGLYRKYAAWRVGGVVFPGHLFFGPSWMLKEPQVVDAHALRAEAGYMQENPHVERLEEAFRIAHIDYGRADYGVVDGRVQVYEINSNPGIPSGPAPGPGALRTAIDATFNAQMLERLRALDES